MIVAAAALLANVVLSKRRGLSVAPFGPLIGPVRYLPGTYTGPREAGVDLRRVLARRVDTGKTAAQTRNVLANESRAGSTVI